jgi:hypothetical protein
VDSVPAPWRRCWRSKGRCRPVGNKYYRILAPGYTSDFRPTALDYYMDLRWPMKYRDRPVDCQIFGSVAD